MLVTFLWGCNASVLEEKGPRDTQHLNNELAQLTLSEVLQYYRDFIVTLDDNPILIGHSMCLEN